MIQIGTVEVKLEGNQEENVQFQFEPLIKNHLTLLWQILNRPEINVSLNI